MTEQYNADWARGVIDGGLERAQGLIGDTNQIDQLMSELQEKLKDVPSTVVGSLSQVPLMASMVKSYVTREYTEVSPKVVVSMVSAFLYLVKKKDLIPDSIPVIGLVDDVAVVTVAMKLCESELQAYSTWRETHQDAAEPLLQLEIASEVAEG